MTNVITLCGSLRKGSYNNILANALPALAPEGMKITAAPSWANFPVYNADIQNGSGFPADVEALAAAIRAADGVIIVTPEYNNGYPGVLKNALDYLLPEYERKPFGIVTVSAGGFGGISCLAQLRLVTLGMGGFPIPESFAVSKVQDSFDEEGNPKNPSLDKRAKDFIDEVLWFTEAIQRQKKAAV